MFANPPFPVGITACRPIYSPSTGALLGVAGLDFLLTAVEQLIISFVPTTIDTIVYILDGTSEQMIASSILGISTNEFGQVNVLECGVPEIEVCYRSKMCSHKSVVSTRAHSGFNTPLELDSYQVTVPLVLSLAENDTDVHVLNESWVQQSFFFEENGLKWRIVVQEQITCMPGYELDLTSTTGSCKKCGGFSTSSAGSITCDLCIENYFFLEGRCEPCGRGTTCPAGTSLATMQINPGYWRSGLASHDVRHCGLGSLACPGLSNSSTFACVEHPAKEKYCACGFRGPLCSRCDARHYAVWTGDGGCEKCGRGRSHIPTIILGIFVFACVLVVAATRMDEEQQSCFKGKRIKELYRVGGVKLGILFFSAQIISEFATISLDTGTVTYPEPAASFASGAFSLD